MAKEYEEYRLVLEALNEHFHKGWLTLNEIAEYDGCDYRTVRTRYGLSKGVSGIDISVLAYRKCQLARK